MCTFKSGHVWFSHELLDSSCFLLSNNFVVQLEILDNSNGSRVDKLPAINNKTSWERLRK